MDIIQGMLDPITKPFHQLLSGWAKKRIKKTDPREWIKKKLREKESKRKLELFFAWVHIVDAELKGEEEVDLERYFYGGKQFCIYDTKARPFLNRYLWYYFTTLQYILP